MSGFLKLEPIDTDLNTKSGLEPAGTDRHLCKWTATHGSTRGRTRKSQSSNGVKFFQGKTPEFVYHYFLRIRILLFVGTYLRVLLDDGLHRFYGLCASPLADVGLDALNLVLMAF